jgi:hypothetical protein
VSIDLKDDILKATLAASGNSSTLENKAIYYLLD